MSYLSENTTEQIQNMHRNLSTEIEDLKDDLHELELRREQVRAELRERGVEV